MRRALLGLVLVLGCCSAAPAHADPVSLPAVPGSETEPNGTFDIASPIASGDRIRADLFDKGDVDFYKFTAAAGDHVFASVITSASAGSSTDSQLTLLASDG